MKQPKRMQREAATVAVMIKRFCRDKHSPDGELCKDCRELLYYATQRLQRCPFQEGKTTCGNCQVHCYQSRMRKKIQEVMRHVGPRMLLTNPIMSLRHALDSLRKTPRKKERN